jgi:hypothetical protein
VDHDSPGVRLLAIKHWTVMFACMSCAHDPNLQSAPRRFVLPSLRRGIRDGAVTRRQPAYSRRTKACAANQGEKD